MAGEHTDNWTGGVVVGIDRGEPGLLRIGRRQAHRPRQVQHQIEIEIGGGDEVDFETHEIVMAERPITPRKIVGTFAE
jgi:hypothetical protein